MGGRYGMSFAAELNEEGRHEEAIEAASKAIDAGDVTPEPLMDRGTAFDLLERYNEAVRDFERAIELNGANPTVDADMLDDAYFGSLVAAARKDADGSKEAASARVGNYARILPKGRHVKDAEDWRARFAR